MIFFLNSFLAPTASPRIKLKLRNKILVEEANGEIVAYVRVNPVVRPVRNARVNVRRPRNKKPIVQPVNRRTRQPDILPSIRECSIVLHRMTPAFLANSLKAIQQNPINQIASTTAKPDQNAEIVALAKLFAGDWFNMRMNEPNFLSNNPEKMCNAMKPFIDKSDGANMLSTKFNFKVVVNLPNKRITTIFTNEAWEKMIETVMNIFQKISFENAGEGGLIGVRANRNVQTFQPNPFIQGTGSARRAIGFDAGNMLATEKVSFGNISIELGQCKTLDFTQDDFESDESEISSSNASTSSDDSVVEV